MKKEVITINSLPKTAEELKAAVDLTSPFNTAAYVIAALMNYENNPQETENMLNVLKGPEALSPFQSQFIRERLRGKMYVVRSYFKGTSPDNNYQPSMPYQIEISDNPYSYQDEGYATLWLTSSGADNPRPVKLRNKPSTGEWFLFGDITYLSDIRIPTEQDPWA